MLFPLFTCAGRIHDYMKRRYMLSVTAEARDTDTASSQTCSCVPAVGDWNSMRDPPSIVTALLLMLSCLSHNVVASDTSTRPGIQAGCKHAVFGSPALLYSGGRIEGPSTPTTTATAAACRALRAGASAALVPQSPQQPPTTSASSNSSTSGLRHRTKVLGYFGLWYALNVWYNVVNKKVLNALPLPSSVAVLQLGIGSLWVGTQWLLGLRTPPGVLTSEGAARLTPVAFFHGGGQLATVLSLGAGAVSFTHVVKALEPFFSALVAAVWFHQVFRWQVYASLVPVVAGVSLACAKEINFSWVSFLAAMASNLLFVCRSNFSKALMTRPPFRDGATTSSANLYGLVTVMSFAVFAPWAAVTEWAKWAPAWESAVEKSSGRGDKLALSVVLSGIFHYLNNEVMYLALGSVHPTTLAVGNTMKRVFLVVASLIVFKTPISRMGMVGSAIGIGGVLFYSLARQHYGEVERSTAKQQ